MAETDRAIIVGINLYPELGDLEGPENDVNAFYDWLVSREGGDVPAQNIKRIRSSDYGPTFASVDVAEPTILRIQSAWRELYKIAQDNPEGLYTGRRLYLYFAGHGFSPDPTEENRTALLVANATRIETGSHVIGQYMAEWFRRAGIFDEVVLIMDCCRENYRAAGLTLLFNFVNTDGALARVKYLYALATQWSQDTREKLLDGQQRGVFTYALLKGLTGGAVQPDDPEGKITAGSLRGYLENSENIKRYLTDEEWADAPQLPKANYEPESAADTLVFTKVPPPQLPVVIKPPPGSEGKQIQVLRGDRSFAVAATTTVVASTTPWHLSLGRGTYLAQVVGTDLQTVVEVSGTGEVNVNF